MIDHLSIGVTDLAKSKVFYENALRPLGYRVEFELDEAICFSLEGLDLWIGLGEPSSQLHFAFRAASREVVDQFYQAAMATGGRDNGEPGLRPQYHANYYGAFVLDPDGYNVEAVCHKDV